MQRGRSEDVCKHVKSVESSDVDKCAMEATNLDNIFLELDLLIKATHLRLSKMTSLLKRVTNLTKQEYFRNEVSHSHWNIMYKILNKVCDDLNTSIVYKEVDFFSEIYRCLRNICADCAENDLVSRNVGVFKFARRIFSFFLVKGSSINRDQELVILQCGLQYFGNLSQNNGIKPCLRSYIYGHSEKLLKSNNCKILELTMMVLYSNMTEDLVNIYVLEPLINCLCENLFDWGMFIIEKSIEKEDFMDTYFVKLSVRNRLFVLDLITECIENPTESRPCKVPFTAVKHVADLFLTVGMDIVKISSSNEPDLKAIEICKILSVLCAASAFDKYSEEMKAHSEISETAIDILKVVHLLGKTESNLFSPLSNLRETNMVKKEEVELSLSYGFKKNLIRLIGNNCFKSKSNQDLVRRLDGIPLLLDCMNLDARNPYILQWCIFAIRNVLENNHENQEFLANTCVTGDLVDSALLQELGLKVCLEDGKPTLSQLIVKP